MARLPLFSLLQCCQTLAVASSARTSTPDIEAVIQAQVREARVAVLGRRAGRKVKVEPKAAEPAPVAQVKSAKAVEPPKERVMDEPVAAVAVVSVAAEVNSDVPEALKEIPPEAQVAAAEPAATDIFDTGKQSQSLATAAVEAQETQPDDVMASAPAITSVAPPVVPARPISMLQLSRVLEQISTTYDAGAATAFSSLFTDNARTTDADGHRAIYRLYKTFFARPEAREMVFTDFSWASVTARSAYGSGNVEVLTTQDSGGGVDRGRLRMTIGVVRQGEALRISEMYYEPADGS